MDAQIWIVVAIGVVLMIGWTLAGWWIVRMGFTRDRDAVGHPHADADAPERAVPVRAAGPQQGQRGGDGPLGTVQIRREDPRWSPRRQQARRGLVVDVMAWHVRAVPVVSGDVHLADPPVAGADGVGVQAQPAQRPGAVGGEEHVRLGQDLLAH